MAENPAGGPPDDNDQPSWSDWDSIRPIRKSQPTIRQTPDVGLTKNDTVDSIDSQTEGKEGDGRS